ncbi:branched-chain amino acid ABC transporter permease [Acidihalobacter ferrooxydans]|uniref:Branched-chain amino acid ABC transporter permease n=1 Tax=Acidihalobacter ferrooxydans TaxID=1765967 RepID=A0A1P8UHP0_9GAMM|nr:branched-chain amino acid ABC transporter permease [Acidihalobacter ferrooxydans]APZ43294.1 branched-chain amino acid ABC transporter permease [Acidihalobacter ferrooxydans]
MIAQYLADGIVLGSTLALGAVGLTLTYNILNFANFAHGSLLTWGAYFAWIVIAAFSGVQGTFGSLSFGWPFILALIFAAVMTSVLALVVDWLVFRILRKSNIQVALVIASFGASLLLRNLIVVIFGPEPEYYSDNIQIAKEILPGVRVTPDQLFVVGLSIVLVIVLHLFMTRTKLGKAMRATADNTALAQVTGINIQGIVRWTWIVGASLAAVAGVFFGLTVQILPDMGFNLLLFLFAAAILGGVGSIYGAILGGMVIGIAADLSVLFISPAYKPAVAFIIMILVLLVRPSGILGEKTR